MVTDLNSPVFVGFNQSLACDVEQCMIVDRTTGVRACVLGRSENA